MDRDALVKLYLDGFPTDSEAFARAFVAARSEEDIFPRLCDGQPVSVSYAVKKRARLFGAVSEAVYFSGISTRSDCRGKGLVGETISDALNALAHRGYPVVFLCPFSDTYYLRHGFATVSRRGKRRVVGGERVTVRRATRADYPLIRSIYRTMSAAYDDVLLYGRAELDALFDDFERDGGRAEIAFDSAGKAQAFAVIEGDTATHCFWRDVRFFQRIEAWRGCAFDDMTAEETPYIQMRIVNAAEALAQSVFSADGEYAFCLSDPLIAANNGGFRVSVRGGINTVVRAFVSAPALTVSTLAARMFDGTDVWRRRRLLFLDTY